MRRSDHGTGAKRHGSRPLVAPPPKTPQAPESQQQLAIAYVAGAAVEELPGDLYIPPNALEVYLEAFEGPLDLLLYLIKRQNIDILEVDVAEITDQYMAYIELMQAGQFELAAEYMVMAAMLAEIKSRILLPRPETAEEEEADPRMQLIRRLLEYERYKLAAENLDDLPRLNRELRQARAGLPKIQRTIPEPVVELSDLLAAMAGALRQAELFEHHHVSLESISTEEKIGHLLRSLEKNRFVPLVSLLDSREGRLGVVVTFLAIMEMMRGAMVEIVQSDVFGPIHLRLAGKEPGKEESA
ncbi:MAG: segregation/condensation protein A [Gammaproteobacteria bacterium]|nr:segregation/condensation protein A [Gammaproteobacteria bacterium]MYH85964.1 segregation/condensation protein A [Gammaproteobacteria bacterium]MYK03837.1 segregation/condensation protein A [Gammaproteobacteria bacterium]